MMGERSVRQETLFYGSNLDDHVPADHMLRSINRFVELSGIRRQLAPYYSAIGRPSIDPELMIRMLLSGYCMTGVPWGGQILDGSLRDAVTRVRDRATLRSGCRAPAIELHGTCRLSLRDGQDFEVRCRCPGCK